VDFNALGDGSELGFESGVSGIRSSYFLIGGRCRFRQTLIVDGAAR